MSNPTTTLGVKQDDWALSADKAKEAALSVGEKVSQAGSAIGAMVSQAGSAVGSMASQAGSVASQAGSMASQAASDVGRKADDLTASAGVGIRHLGDRLDRSGPQEGVLGSASHAVAKTVRDGGEYLEDAKLSGVTRDVARLIRQNPIPAVCIAIGLGWLVARKLRN